MKRKYPEVNSNNSNYNNQNNNNHNFIGPAARKIKKLDSKNWARSQSENLTDINFVTLDSDNHKNSTSNYQVKLKFPSLERSILTSLKKPSADFLSRDKKSRRKRTITDPGPRTNSSLNLNSIQTQTSKHVDFIHEPISGGLKIISRASI